MINLIKCDWSFLVKDTLCLPWQSVFFESVIFGAKITPDLSNSLPKVKGGWAVSFYTHLIQRSRSGPIRQLPTIFQVVVVTELGRQKP